MLKIFNGSYPSVRCLREIERAIRDTNLKYAKILLDDIRHGLTSKEKLERLEVLVRGYKAIAEESMNEERERTESLQRRLEEYQRLGEIDKIKKMELALEEYQQFGDIDYIIKKFDELELLKDFIPSV